MKAVLVVTESFSNRPGTEVLAGLGKDLETYSDTVEIKNAETQGQLEECLNEAFVRNYGIIFWLAGERADEVKAQIPETMLVTAIYDETESMGTQQLVERALEVKANLLLGFHGNHIRMVDPLGCIWYEGASSHEMFRAALKRLYYLESITRKKTATLSGDMSLPLKWYFDQFEQEMSQQDGQIEIPKEGSLFLNIVNHYSDMWRHMLPVKMNPKVPQVGRCAKGMVSFRDGGNIYASKRVVKNAYLHLEDLCPVMQDPETGDFYYYGDAKPAVDTPIHMELYKKLRNIRYIIHSHAYIEGAPMTKACNPCGAMEEVDEILDAISICYSNRSGRQYLVNLKGHGSIAMGNQVSDLKDIRYWKRPMPEYMVDE